MLEITEDSSNKSAIFFEHILDSLIDGVIITDIQTRKVNWCNRAFCRMLGYSKEEIQSLGITNIHPKDSLGYIETLLNQFSNEEIDQIKNIPVQRKDGTVFWVDITASPTIFNNVSNIVATFKDITQKKDAQHHLEESESRYRMLFEKAAVAIAISRSGKLIFANKRFIDMFGYSDTSEILGRSLFDFVASESLSMVQYRHEHKPYDSEMMDPSELEGMMQRKDGSKFWIHAAISNVFLSGDLASFGFITDITQKKAAEEALKKSEEEYRSLINNMQDAVYKCDLQGTILFTTPSAARMLGIASANELIGKNIARDFNFYPKEQGKLLNLLKRNEYVTNYEITLKTKNDTPIVVSTNSQFSRDQNGTICGIEGIFNDITVRKQMENKLRENEQLLNELYKMVQLGHWIWDITTGTIEWSEVMFTILHLDKATFVPRSDAILDLLPDPRDRKQFQKYVNNAMKSREKISFEQRFQLPDGSIGYYQSTIQGQYDHNGTLRSIVGTILDITVRKHTEETLKNNEALLRSIFNVSPAGIMFLINRKIKKINNALSRITGYSENELLEQDTRILYVNDDEYREIGKLYHNINPDNLAMNEARLRCKNGQVINVVVSLSALNPNDFSQGVTATLLDTTMIKKAEEAFKKSEVVIKSLFDATPVGLGLIIDNKFTKINNALCKIMGYTKSELLGSPADILFSDIPQNYEKLVPEPYKQIESEGCGIIESTFTNKKGQTLNAIISLRRFDIDNCANGRVVSILDITEFKNMAIEKAHLEEMLLHSQKLESIGRLAGGIAHDFNNILTAIMGNTDIVLSQLNQSDGLYSKLKVVMEAAEGAANLTRQLLAFSRRQVIEPKIININTIIERIRKIMQTLIGENISLDIVCSPNLHTVKADPGQIEQILINLTANARDAMPKGGKLIIKTSNVTIDNQYASSHINVTPGHHVLISVEDTGYGMSKEIQNHIFEPFFTTKEKGRGTGLGLATVYGIIKQSGGSIELYSDLGKGSIFNLYLPIIQQSSFEQNQPAREQKIILSGTETILVAEDNNQVRDFISIILRNSGYTILAACSGEDALTISENHSGDINLFITDVILPGINGRVAAETLARLRPSIKTLYMSGYTAEVIDKQGILDEGITFIRKPFTAQEIRKKIRDVLDNKSPS